MTQASNLTGAGMPAELARLLGQTSPQTGKTATGSTIADALALTSGEVAVFGTVGSGTGTLLPFAGESAPVTIYNGGSNALTVYPQAGDYVNGTVNATFSVTNGKAAIFMPAGLHWIANLSA